MPLTPLTPAELALLDDPTRRSQFVQIPLADRLVEQLEVADLAWGASSFGGSTFREVTFRGCTFAGVDFERVELRSVRFEACKFDECRFMRAQLHRTQFSGCELIETYWRESELLGCVLEMSTLSGGWFEANEMQLRLHGGSFDGVRFVRCTLDAQLNEVKVNALRLTLCTVGRLVLQHCEIDGLQLLGGTCAALLAFGGTARDVRCGEMSCGRIELEQVPEVETLYINKCAVDELALLECRVSDLYVFESHARRLSIHGGQVSGWFTHSVSLRRTASPRVDQAQSMLRINGRSDVATRWLAAVA